MAGQDYHPLPDSFLDQSHPRSNYTSGSIGGKRLAEHLVRPEEKGRIEVYTANPSKDGVSIKRQKTNRCQTTKHLVTPLYLMRKAVTQDPNHEERNDDDRILTGLSSDVRVAMPAKNKRPRRSPDTVSIDDEDKFMFQACDQDKHELPQSLVLESFAEVEARKDAANDDIDDGQEEHIIEDIPLGYPSEAFTVAPPPKDLSWIKTPYPPTLQYINQDSCPIDWDYIKAHSDGLELSNIQAYEFRKPWISKAQGGEVGYEKMVKMFHDAGDTAVNQLESARKRFKKANNIVFLTTGVFFESSMAGLPDDYKPRSTKERKKQQQNHQLQRGTVENRIAHNVQGPPADQLYQDAQVFNNGDDCDDNDVSDDETDSNEGSIWSVAELTPGPPYMVHKDALPPDDCRGSNITTFILQPPQDKRKDCCCICCSEGMCYSEECRKEYQGSETNTESDHVFEDFGHHYNGPPWIRHSRDDWLASLKAQRAPFDECPHHNRVQRYIDTKRFLAVRQTSSSSEDLYLINMTPKAFDVMTSCFAPRLRKEVPEVLENLAVFLEYEDEIDGKEYSSAYYQEDASGYTVADLVEAYCGSQALQMPMVSDIILDTLHKLLRSCESHSHESHTGVSKSNQMMLLEPETIRYAWCHTYAGDPLRLFFLDLYRLKPNDVEYQIQQRGAQYPSELLRYWNEWKLSQQNETPSELSAKGEQATTKLSNDTFIGPRGPTYGLIGNLRLARENEPSILGGVVFEGWIRKSWKPFEFYRDQLHERFTQTASVDELSSGTHDSFCHTYHNHGSFESPAYQCYRSRFS